MTRKGIYLGLNSCYLNTAFQLLVSINEFVDIFINKSDFDNIYYTNSTTKQNVELKELFNNIKEIIYNILEEPIYDIKNHYEYIATFIFPNESHTSQQHTEEFINILYNIFVNVNGSNRHIIDKIKIFLNVINIKKKT